MHERSERAVARDSVVVCTCMDRHYYVSKSVFAWNSGAANNA